MKPFQSFVILVLLLVVGIISCSHTPVLREESCSKEVLLLPGTYSTDDFLITTESDTIESRIDVAALMRKVPESFSNVGPRIELYDPQSFWYQFSARRESFVQYIVVCNTDQSRVPMGLVSIYPTEREFVIVSHWLFGVFFNKTKLEKYQPRVSVEYEVYGFQGDSLIVADHLWW